MPKVAVRYTDYFALTIRRIGTVFGRDHDKFLEKRLTPVSSRQVRALIIQESVVTRRPRSSAAHEIEEFPL